MPRHGCDHISLRLPSQGSQSAVSYVRYSSSVAYVVPVLLGLVQGAASPGGQTTRLSSLWRVSAYHPKKQIEENVYA